MSSSVRVWRLGSGAAAILFSTLGRCVTFVSPTNERNQTTKKKQRESHRGPNLEPERAKKQNKRRHVFLGGTRSWKSSNGSTFQILKNKNQKKKKEKKMAGHFRLSAGGGSRLEILDFFWGFFGFFALDGFNGFKTSRFEVCWKEKKIKWKWKKNDASCNFFFLRRHEMRLPMRVALFGYVDCSRRN